MVNFFVWLIVGGLIGWVASSLMGTRSGLLINIIVGIAGAFVAGLVLTPVLGIPTINENSNFSLPSLLVSLGGAIILLAVVSLFRRRGTFR